VIAAYLGTSEEEAEEVAAEQRVVHTIDLAGEIGEDDGGTA
jgi:hypothetical protein